MRRLAVFFAVMAALPTSSIASAQEKTADETRCAPGWESTVSTTVKSSVVRISDGGGWGAGFVWKDPRRIVTAMHVVSRARNFDIYFAEGTRGRAHIVAGNEREDIAARLRDYFVPGAEHMRNNTGLPITSTTYRRP